MQDWHPSHTNTTRFDPLDEYHIKVKHIALPPSKTSNKNETNGNSDGPNRFDTEARSTTPSTPPLRGLVDPRTVGGNTLPLAARREPTLRPAGLHLNIFGNKSRCWRTKPKGARCTSCTCSTSKIHSDLLTSCGPSDLRLRR